ncbi:aminoglycoside phosphotransferase family protein [Streptomyces sp. NPDC002265]|uniref:phosphotransferase family protein n=1 Tax=Streptomyces sp. NPDC002265 TaxID=3154415 RepID=UPI00332BBCD9
MLHHLPHRARTALVRVLAEARRRRACGPIVVGHHNRNHILPLGLPLASLLGMGSGQVRAKFRVPLATVEVVPRIWRESEVLDVVSERLAGVPRCLADFGAWSLHAYVPGHALSEEPPGTPVGEPRMEALADFFAQLAGIPPQALPRPADDWPRGDDSRAFLHRLARFTEQRVHRANRPRFGSLFDSVGIPADLVSRFLRTVPDPVRRPFGLLHTDVHRANIVVTPEPGGGDRLTVLDWELSLYGDVLHDLATHLVRMEYDPAERKLMTELWAEAMRKAGRADLTEGLDPDLGTYLGFEHVQSVFPDVMRAALDLPAEPTPEDLGRSADRVHRALDRARGPLWMPGEPQDRPALVRALRRWHSADRARQSAAHRAERPGKGGAEACRDADRPRGADRSDGIRHGTRTWPPTLRREPRSGPDRERCAELVEPLEGLEPHGC